MAAKFTPEFMKGLFITQIWYDKANTRTKDELQEMPIEALAALALKLREDLTDRIRAETKKPRKKS